MGFGSALMNLSTLLRSEHFNNTPNIPHIIWQSSSNPSPLVTIDLSVNILFYSNVFVWVWCQGNDDLIT